MDGNNTDGNLTKHSDDNVESEVQRVNEQRKQDMFVEPMFCVKDDN